MNLAICGSMQFGREMMDLKQRLEAHGHTVTVPKYNGQWAFSEELTAGDEAYEKGLLETIERNI